MGGRPGMLLLALAAAAIGLFALVGFNDERFASAPENEREAQPVVQVRRAPAPARSGAPPEVLAAAREWPLPHHDYANTRATSDATIDSANVARLGIAWTKQLIAHSHWGAAASAPVIADGVVYFQDLLSDVFAIDLRTGATRWHAPINEDAFGPNGASIGYGKVFAQDGESALRALDLRSGRPLWRSQLAGPTGTQQPIPYGGFVYTGLSAGGKYRNAKGHLKMHLLEPGSSGWVYGLRQDDGRVVWGFRTVQRGFWGNKKVNSGGGIWYAPAVDAASGATYWTTGNPAPGPGTQAYPNAKSRPGPNLYTNTALAFDGRSGRLLWHRQLAPHDLFHHDIQNPPILVRAGGRDLVIASGKTGKVYALDRASGNVVWQRSVGIHRNDELTALPADGRPVDVWPGFWGGIEAPGAAAAGSLYFEVEDMPTPYSANSYGAHDAAQTVQNHEGRTRLDHGRSRIVALDAATGRILWQHLRPVVGFGGVTVVNDLLLTATYDGRMEALRRRDGTVAWAGQGPAGIIAWPAVSGDTIVWPAGLGRDPRLVALRLGAHEQVPPARTQVRG